MSLNFEPELGHIETREHRADIQEAALKQEESSFFLFTIYNFRTTIQTITKWTMYEVARLNKKSIYSVKA